MEARLNHVLSGRPSRNPTSSSQSLGEMSYSGAGLIQKAFYSPPGEESYISATTGPGAPWKAEKGLEKLTEQRLLFGSAEVPRRQMKR